MKVFISILRAKRRQQVYKYFSAAHLFHNPLATNALQNLLFCIAKA